MKYYGKELIEMEPENWNGKTREMVVWNDVYNYITPITQKVCGYDPIHLVWKIAGSETVWKHCAEIPKESTVMDKIEQLESENDRINKLLWSCFLSKTEFTMFKNKIDENTQIIKSLKESDGLNEECISFLTNKIHEFADVIQKLNDENDELKAKIKSLLVERIKMADSVSSAVWNELMERAKNIEGPVNTSMAGFGFNDISDIVLNKIIDYKPEKKLRRMTYKELDEWLEQGKGVVKIADHVSNTITYDCESRNQEVYGGYKICGYDEDTWHYPMIEV